MESRVFSPTRQLNNSYHPFVPLVKQKFFSKSPVPAEILALQSRPSSCSIPDISQAKTVASVPQHPYEAEILALEPPEQYHNVPAKPKLPTGLVPAATMISTEEGLTALRGKLRLAREFAVDLEHHSVHSYLGFTCLLQISTRTEDFVVDVFPVWDHVSSLGDVFANPRIVKVFHGATNDVQWLQRDFGIYVVGLFDTFHV